MTKIVISSDYGGQGSGIGNFRLSDDAVDYLVSKKGWNCYTNVDDVDESNPYIFQWESQYIPSRVEYVVPLTNDLRLHKDLIECIETLGAEASGYFSNLKVVDVPNDVKWEIKQCNGVEWVAEVHRTWR